MTLLVGAAALAGSVAAMATPGSPEPARGANIAADNRTTTILDQVSKAWLRNEWAAYRDRFVSPDGRVIDNANGGVSHSEGQGYGLLLALAADDATSFATIWQWTADHLRKRSDALFAWKWDPLNRQVTDLNDAADGDILIAWALAKAAERFGRPDYTREARAIAEAVARELIKPTAIGPILLPGVQGFTAADRHDGPVVNLSYWVFPAFRELALLVPDADWEGLHRTGLRLLDASRFGPRRLPSNWVALGGPEPTPARNYPAEFGYDAIRIPLYLAGDPDVPRETLARFAAEALAKVDSSPAVIDIASGSNRQVMSGAGYSTVLALARCIASGTTISPNLISSRDNLYYPETLRLLSLALVQERYPRCL